MNNHIANRNNFRLYSARKWVCAEYLQVVGVECHRFFIATTSIRRRLDIGMISLPHLNSLSTFIVIVFGGPEFRASEKQLQALTGKSSLL